MPIQTQKNAVIPALDVDLDPYLHFVLEISFRDLISANLLLRREFGHFFLRWRLKLNLVDLVEHLKLYKLKIIKKNRIRKSSESTQNVQKLVKNALILIKILVEMMKNLFELDYYRQKLIPNCLKMDSKLIQTHLKTV